MKKTNVLIILGGVALAALAASQLLTNQSQPEVLGSRQNNGAKQTPQSAETKKITPLPPAKPNAETPNAIVNQIIKEAAAEDLAAKEQDNKDREALQKDLEIINSLNEVTNE